jgi:hypothetical protein
VLAALQGQLALGLALDALQSQHNLLGGLGLLVEDGLGLTTITGLLAVITALSLSEQRGLASLVLGDLVLGVLAALLALAVGVTGLGNVDLISNSSQFFSVPFCIYSLAALGMVRGRARRLRGLQNFKRIPFCRVGVCTVVPHGDSNC